LAASIKGKIDKTIAVKTEGSPIKTDKQAAAKAISKAAVQKTVPVAERPKDRQAAAPVTKGGTPAKSPAKPGQGQIPEASDRNKVTHTKLTTAHGAVPVQKVATPTSPANGIDAKKILGGRTPSEKLAAVRAAAAKAAAKSSTSEPAKAIPSVPKPVIPPTKAAGIGPAIGSAPAAPVGVPPAKVPSKVPYKHGFKTNEFIVYPSHGVGQILAIEEQEVAGFRLELFIINFVKDKLTLKVPLPKVTSVGMRKLAEPEVVTKALDTLTGRARIKRTMWSRRAQEYEAKINSGDLVAIAEVVRDLYRSEAQPEQSYSERQLYEAALDRMAREIAAVQRLTETESLKLIEANLQKGPRRGAKVEADGDGDPDASGDIEEAA
jgi:CarD family transcriptional regulator